MEVFAEVGYRRASMDQVAEEAGLSRQTVYHYFKTKSELFRASVEALHEGAHEAESKAGLEAEESGRGLADILAAQIEARFRYLLECLEETSQPEELLSERQSQARDLIQSFVDQHVRLNGATIARVCAAQGLTLRERMTPADLARAIQIAVSGFGDLKFKISFVNELHRLVRLIVTGAVIPASRPEKRRKTPVTRKPRKRK